MQNSGKKTVLNVYPSKFGGGAQSVFKNTCELLKEKGDFISLNGSLDVDSDLVLKRSIFGISNIIRTFIYIKKNQVDIFHFHGGLTLGILFPFLLLIGWLQKNIRIVFTAHNYAMICPSQKRYHYKARKPCDRCSFSSLNMSYFSSGCEEKKIGIKLVKWMYSVNLRLALLGDMVSVLTPSTFSANVFKSNNIENIVVANNPVNFSNEKSQVNPQSIECLKNEIVFLGRFVEEKGVYDFCDEIISNKNYYKNVKVNLIGDGPEKNSIISMLEEHGIDFTDFGFCDKGRVKSILLNSNVIVVPSIWDETFGLVVAEAIFNFCIPVVSNRGALHEIVDKAGVGNVFDCSSSQDLHRAIEKSFSEYNEVEWNKVLLNLSLHLSDDNYFSHLKAVYDCK
ncbi:glycosyltransferase [Vibrio parahaemolyticus]|uniref:glycosyltransferase n=1 Tax=Vibrio parahaemolyticus TaxID=670 RepID=UPI00084B3BA8|nr:glycosyltransferase [Vibrio parahaemolyticus]EGR2692650.1 glycosyltransferase [Vibrio parahaemolyticus]EGR2707652.1 glycosyltransferase [Vibrio parahaemolyticus]MBE4203303.1 glycosyltransferase family 4 protein [Vibrio parahaemolyticus]ODZ30871.1 hypothetical protein BBM37_19435 [Vibrio parahaemolyticus]ODZ35814.1 hypothetical protein BBM38_11165 [Vibrio parahaemolyticus]